MVAVVKRFTAHMETARHEDKVRRVFMHENRVRIARLTAILRRDLGETGLQNFVERELARLPTLHVGDVGEALAQGCGQAGVERQILIQPAVGLVG